MALIDAPAVAVPPPAYREGQNSLDALPRNSAEISTLSGKIQTNISYDVTHVPGVRVEDRKVVLKDEASGTDDFVVTLETHAPSTEIRKMVLHHSSPDGLVEASVTIPATDEVLAIVTRGSNKTKIAEHRSKSSIRASQAAAKNGDDSKHSFEVGDLVWRVSKKYLHPTKGKSRAGDLELVDRDGNVIAAFLNQWNGSPHATGLGKLHLTTAISASQNDSVGMVPLIILSALSVVVHLSFRDRDGAKDFVRDIMTGAAMCAVM